MCGIINFFLTQGKVVCLKIITFSKNSLREPKSKAAELARAARTQRVRNMICSLFRERKKLWGGGVVGMQRKQKIGFLKKYYRVLFGTAKNRGGKKVCTQYY